MPRYFFDYRDGDHLAADSEGTELPDLTSAQAEAVATLAELARDALPGFREKRLAILVRDESGRDRLELNLRFEVRTSDLEG
jgi:hypothetical protein